MVVQFFSLFVLNGIFITEMVFFFILEQAKSFIWFQTTFFGYGDANEGDEISDLMLLMVT